MGLFRSIKEGLKKTADVIGQAFVAQKKLDQEFMEQLEDSLLMSDLGPTITAQIIEEIGKKKFAKDADPAVVKDVIKDVLARILINSDEDLFAKIVDFCNGQKANLGNVSKVTIDFSNASNATEESAHENKKKLPFVIMMCGVNGNGKTTSCGKLAHMISSSNIILANKFEQGEQGAQHFLHVQDATDITTPLSASFATQSTASTPDFTVDASAIDNVLKHVKSYADAQNGKCSNSDTDAASKGDNSIAKHTDATMTVMLAACDTFRAAAVEQLEIWSKRTNSYFICGKENADPASVVYEAYNAAVAKQVDVLIIDTAGRMHNNNGLMEELSKCKRVLRKIDANIPHETILVLDGTTGQNAYKQLEAFTSTIDVTGIILTKLDSTSKGGVAMGLYDKYKLPVYFVGVGESVNDLRKFNIKDFVDAMVS